ncbi:MAG: hypothetical protein KKF62_17780 [Bacteroidetes bacterium]|nr:hypothetical protein [Bacteroidota bacterium]MBU1115584.1 hypothetical protein [Bacteroidota bacterium]
MKKYSLIVLIALSVVGCSTTYTNRNPVGEIFPTVSGESLEKIEIEMPQYFNGSKVILLLGYKQDSQFDIDRWLIGLDQTETKAKIYELPTIQGLFPRMFSTFIDNGMRKGIPKELWGGVITIYRDGSVVQEFTGNENGNNARVLVIDENGKVIYFYDRGFAVSALNQLRQKLAN